MANGTNEAECVTCANHKTIDAKLICIKFERIIPTQLGPHLICRAWQNQLDPADDGKYYKETYFRDATVLYKYDIYFVKKPQVVCAILDLPSSMQQDG